MADWEGLGATPDAVGLLLREAAQRLRDRGWVQGRFSNDEGAMDATQAIASVLDVQLTSASKRDARIPAGACVLLGAALERMCARLDVRALSVWNDMEPRTADDVVRELDTAGGAV